MRRSGPNGFTLVEMLVVITILLLLTFFVITAFNRTTGGDRLRAGARTAQSAFLGARDRALHAKQKRGIRFIRDANDPTLAVGFIYLQPIENQIYPEGSIQLERRDEIPAPTGDVNPDSADIVIVRGFAPPAIAPNVDWATLTDFFATPPRIRIPAKTGQWYTYYWTTTGVYAFNPSQPVLQLTTPFVDPGNPASVIAHSRFPASSFTSCEIEMAPELLPHHAPIYLPSGVVIDLDYSSPSINANWPAGPPSANIDLMFSPRGGLSGPLSALGPIHLLLNDVQDAAQNLSPIDPLNKSEKRILTIFPQTGHVATYDIDPTDSDNNGIADDLFRYAKRGAAAN